VARQHQPAGAAAEGAEQVRLVRRARDLQPFHAKARVGWRWARRSGGAACRAAPAARGTGWRACGAPVGEHKGARAAAPAGRARGLRAFRL